MNRILLDTNVLSETVNLRPDPQVSTWFATNGAASLCLSVVSLGELRRGVELLDPGKRRTRLELWLDVSLAEWLGDGILPVTASVADCWGVMDAKRRRAGRPLDLADGLIAATAQVHDLALATRNTKDFDGLGLTLVNPWRI